MSRRADVVRSRGRKIIGTHWQCKSGNILIVTQSGRDIFGTPSVRVSRIGVQRGASSDWFIEPEDFGVWNVCNLRRSASRVRP